MAREKTCAMDCKCRKDDDPTPCHTVTPTLKELTEELARVKAHLSAMDDKYEEAMAKIATHNDAQHRLDATYPWLRQLYAMWPNQYLKDFLVYEGEF